MITKTDLTTIRAKINNALQEIANEYDAKMSIGSMGYGVDNPKSIFKTHSGRIQFTGYSTRSKKYPFIYQNLDNGKSYKCGYDQAELYATKEQVE